ncbi:MAG: LptE family protein [Candidatus Omnitrophota bacterium]
MNYACLYRRGFMAFSLAGLLLVSGCGYTTRSAICERYHTVYVQPFVNKINITSEADSASKYQINKPMVETDVTRAVVNKFLFDGNLRPVKEGEADLILKGEVVEFRQDALRYTENDDVEEYRLNIIVNISMWDAKENRLLWEEKGFTGYDDYFTTYAASSVVSTKSMYEATPGAIDDLARRIVERAVEEW